MTNYDTQYDEDVPWWFWVALVLIGAGLLIMKL